ncbi:unnamed protein product [Hermetia illucens]|uniref:Uncharacterized protein n=1 Tax=Hermetia illucens TaxID=343691 RepID=A0A7R8V7K7_HERIL|nr:unnamed protein product [Hermetia illucens]
MEPKRKVEISKAVMTDLRKTKGEKSPVRKRPKVKLKTNKEAMANIADGSGQRPKSAKEKRCLAMDVSSGSDEDLDRFVRERGLNKRGSGPLTRAGFQDDILSESSDSAEEETVEKGKRGEGTWEQVKGSKKRHVTRPEQPSKGPAKERRAEGTSDEMFKVVKRNQGNLPEQAVQRR